MTGLDKIVEQIGAIAAESAREIITKAKNNALEEKKRAVEKAEKQCLIIQRQSKNDVTNQLDRAISVAALQKRKMILSAKQEVINGMIEKAYHSLVELSDHDYFEMLLKMIKKHAFLQKGEILFSPDDLKRMPKDFQDRVNEVFLDKNGSLIVSSQTRAIDGGFVLVYGEIEENCSFSALFYSNREIFQDKVNELLFF